MKKTLLSLTVFLSSFISHAQSDSSYFELGLNAIKLTNFLGVADDAAKQDDWNPYMLTANYGRNKLALRCGMGYSSSFRVEEPTPANGESTFDTTAKTMDFRFGVGREFSLSPKWTFRMGLDYFVANRFSSYEAKFKDHDGELIENVREISYKEKGVAPFLFVQYNFTSRVSCGTELLYRISAYTMSDKDISSGNSTQINKDYTGAKRNLMAPSALFIQIRF
ncbi:MAG: hypothetical protein ACKO7B_15565 [Flavobacteriales bacterium]